MKYAIQPVLAEIDQYVLDNSLDGDVDRMVELTTSDEKDVALRLLLKLYHANNGTNANTLAKSGD